MIELPRAALQAREIAATAGGFAYPMSGRESLAPLIDSERSLRKVLQIPDQAEVISYSDPKKSVYRYAGVMDGRLEACVFFAAPCTAFVEAEPARGLLGQVLEPVARLALLAGMMGRARSSGMIICSCFSVGEATICDTIRSNKLTTAAEVGAILRAGTNCGSCLPELKKLLAASAAELSEVA